MNDGWSVAQPYPVLHGGGYVGEQVAESPDPLVSYRWVDPKATDGMQIYPLRPVSASTDEPTSFRNLDSVTTAACDVEVVGVGSIRFDFGVNSPAWLEFDSPDLSGSVELSVSEYNLPAVVNPGPEHPVKTSAPTRHEDAFRLELNKELFEGLRFGWIHVRALERPWRITAVRAVCQVKPANYEGAFACSDPRITRIWYTGAYAARTGFTDSYYAPILVDRGDRFGWAGDCNTAQAAALVAFANWDVIKLNLDRTVGAAHGIETYSLLWILSLLEYYQHSGDTAAMREYVDEVRRKLDHAHEIYADPTITFYGWDERLGAGFETPDRFETKAGYRMLFIRACREFAAAMDTLGEADIRDRYTQIADSRTTELRADSRWFEPLGVHALAEAVNAMRLDPEERSAIYEREFADRLNRLSYSPFNQCFILQAMSRLGRYDEALLTVRDQWGGQLDYGGTTFFEVFRPDWPHILGKYDPVPNSQSGWTSLGHPWGAGVTSWLSHEVLGVTPTSPGFATVDILPHLGSTLTWVSGSVPTPRGRVEARFDVGEGIGRVSVPDGSVARVGVPKGGRAVTSVTVNGYTVWDGGYHSVPGIGDVREDDEFVVLAAVEPGTYDFAFSYAGVSSEAFVPEDFSYPARFVRQDDTTSGDWGGAYGRDGYVLFNYDGPGHHREQLPSYVGAVTPGRNAREAWSDSLDATWMIGGDDRRAPAPDRSNGLPRNVGCVYTATPTPGGMTMVVDVAVSSGVAYQLALYFVDWDEQGRRSAVEVFDLTTRKLIAPVQLITDFSRGTYLVYACDRSVRLRICHILGDDAVLSGVFFDPIV